jgi:hypothetical protein
VLDRYFIRPATVDRIRSFWIGDAIERYVSWLAEQKYAARSIFIRVPLLIRFGESAQRAGAKALTDLPAHVEPFIHTWLGQCFVLDSDEQKQSGFHYQYSNYQVEYSRNLIFEIGGHMDQVFQALIAAGCCWT